MLFGKLDNPPSLPLVRTTLAVCFCLVLDPALVRSRFPAGLAVWIFEVLFLGQRRGNTAITQVPHDNFVLVFAAPDVEAVAFFQASAGLDPASSDLDLAALDGFPGQRARLEEARSPQPFVYSYRFTHK